MIVSSVLTILNREKIGSRTTASVFSDGLALVLPLQVIANVRRDGYGDISEGSQYSA